jgi:hypothetical protein
MTGGCRDRETRMPLSAEGVKTLQELLRQIRAIPQLRERDASTFVLLGQPFATFDDAGGGLSVALRKASGTGTDRFALDDASQRRKFVDEAKRRAAKLADE